MKASHYHNTENKGSTTQEPAMNNSTDIETLSTKPNALILSIGSLFFNPITGDLGNSFEVTLNPITAPAGLDIDPGTVLWWMKQDDEARAKLTGPTTDYRTGIRNFALWLSNQPFQLGHIWANSPSFDLVILKASFEACNIPWPFKYYNELDIRTIKQLGWPNGDAPNFTKGTKHGALDDAEAQAQLVIEGHKILGMSPSEPKEDTLTPRQRARQKAKRSA
jgi:hypothetical protein